MSIIEPTEPRAASPSGAGTMNPRTAKRIAAFGTIVVVLFGVLVVRLWFLQVVGARGFEAQAVGNSVRTIYIPAPRGQILDRNGQILAGSRPAWDIVALPTDLESEQGRQSLKRVARILDADLTTLRRRVAVAAKRAPHKSVVLKADLDEVADGELLMSLRERVREYPGIRLERTYRRDYPFGATLSHVLGSVGPIFEEEAAERRRQGYRNDAIVGRGGLEGRYEDFLRGVDGERRVEVDVAGQPVGRGTISEKPPRQGLTLQTTIDVEVQKALEDGLREYVERRASLRDGAGGGGVVLDIETGGIVALASYPSLDPQVLSRGRPREVRRLLRNRRKPEINRALWAFPPASTFKPITAIAALNSGVITPQTFKSSPPSVELYGTSFGNFRGLRLDDMQVRRAIAMSSDTWFYQVGADLYAASSRQEQRDGDTKLRFWAGQLGLGRPTGIDVAGEQAGALPDRLFKVSTYSKFKPEDREPDWDKWRPGDTINMSIGQGLVTASPLQMARAYAALVDPEGRLTTPTVGWKVVDPATEETVSDLAKGRPEARVPTIRHEARDAVLGGLYDVTNTSEGTAAGVFSGLFGLVAGKTGTAENPPRPDHAWFVGYGPAGDGALPKYVVAVVVENSGLGAEVAAPVACRALAPALAYDPGRCGRGFRPAADPEVVPD